MLDRRGDYDQAIAAASTAAEEFGQRNGHGPAVCAWRSTMALALHEVGRNDEAVELIEEEIELARRSEITWAIGRALRISGVLATDGIAADLLRQAAEILRDSPARLEYALALAGYRTLLNRRGDSTAARERLAEALDLADRCAALGLIEKVMSEARCGWP